MIYYLVTRSFIANIVSIRKYKNIVLLNLQLPNCNMALSETHTTTWPILGGQRPCCLAPVCHIDSSIYAAWDWLLQQHDERNSKPKIYTYWGLEQANQQAYRYKAQKSSLIDSTAVVACVYLDLKKNETIIIILTIISHGSCGTLCGWISAQVLQFLNK